MANQFGSSEIFSAAITGAHLALSAAIAAVTRSGGTAQRDVSGGGEQPAAVLRLEVGVDRAIELADDLLRRPLRRHHRDPGGRDEIDPALPDGRHVGKEGRPLLGCHGKPRHRRDRPDIDRERRLDVSAEHVLHGGAGAAIADSRSGDAGAGQKHQRREMPGRAGTGMPDVQLAGIPFSVRDEVLKLGETEAGRRNFDVMLDASGLKPSSAGARIKFAGGKRTLIDGPFTETKELVAGYTLIQVKSRQEALEWAKRFPAPHGEDHEGEIEIRPLDELDDFGPSKAIERFRDMGLGTKSEGETS